MKAAVLKDFENIVVEDISEPELNDNDQVLIKVKYAGICGTDVHVYQGHHPAAKPPVVLGHEFSGEIVEIRTNRETDLKVGDNVVGQPFTSCEMCEICGKGMDNVCGDLKIYGVHTNGCFAEYIKVPLRKVFKLSSNVDLRLAALVEPIAVALHDIRKSNLLIGQTAFVIGGGPIGILIAILARLNGASKIALSEVNENRIKFIKELGFDVFNPLNEDVEVKALEMTDKKGFDAVYEVSGSAPGAKLMTDITKTGGKIIIVGVPTGNYPVDTRTIFSRELNVKGVRIHSLENFKAAVSIVESGQVNDDLMKIITDEYSIDDVNEAINFSINDQIHLKVLLRI